ncbi:hypothetical protein AQUCO_02300026v1 [Aquilegia coerulea]|uniref:Probable magnesium transporter n=1 Tax=Aquilegia coerulea TaxID=218851 RepID=A0A2G5DBR1_AQUCA|nr:hypothetical protein AQUCO_02300026v1 [Aquilegia coerulea]
MESSSSSSSSLSGFIAKATADVNGGFGLSDSRSDNLKGILLAVLASAFIGSSFIVKKKGLKRAGSSGPRASVGGYGYLLEPLWWIGMVTMIVGEIANFVAYIFAPAVLITPLGALSIIVSAVLADFLLNEKLQKMGILGCILCIVGSTMIVLHAPSERSLNSVEEIWGLATQPAFLVYTALAVASVLVLMFHCAPSYGQTNILVYIGICSIIGSLTVINQCQSVKTQTPSSSPSFGSTPYLKIHFSLLLESWTSLPKTICRFGYERKSYRDCNKINLRGLEPGFMLPDMDICNGCNHLCYHSAELFEQGIGYFQHCSCVSYLLCNVHISHNTCECNNV